MKNNRFTQIIDVFFIMILCFMTLLSTMLMQGKVLVGSGSSGSSFVYSIHLLTFVPMFLILLVYLVFVCVKSDNVLKDMITALYQSTK